MPMYKKYIPKEQKPLGVCPTCNFGGVCIMEIQHGVDDYVVHAENYGNGYMRISRSMIKYSNRGYPYFIRNKQRWYLNDFMRAS